MASLRKRGKVWYYRFTDADGVKVERKGCADKRATEGMAHAAETEAARLKEGLIDPKDIARKRHEAAPIASHLDDWQSNILAKGGTEKYADLSHGRAARLVAVLKGASLAEVDAAGLTVEKRRQAEECLSRRLRTARLSDLTAVAVQAILADLRTQGVALGTINHYRSAIRAFSRWAWKDGRLKEDALAVVSGYNAKEDPRHDRRTVSVEELRRLVRVAAEGPPYQQMSGPLRALCYRLAVATGLRFSEIGTILPESFAGLDGDQPTVTVGAAYTKNRKPATLPISADVAEDIRVLLASVDPGEPVFPLPSRGADMLKVDLQAAEIPYRDAGGLVFDFHSLRCQCATIADLSGVTPRVVQKLMRHSTLELTGKYTRPRMHDIEGAASSMPTLRPQGPEAMEARATGTDGQRIGDRLAHHLPTGGDVSGRDLAVTGEMAGSSADLPAGRNPLALAAFDTVGRDVAVTDSSSGGGIRTPDTRIMIPLL
jgi:integrase